MAITGEIDLTQGLDFFRHKELPSIITRVLPWEKEKEKTDISSLAANTEYLPPSNVEADISVSSNSRIISTNSYSTTIRVNYNINNTISSYSDNFDTTIGWYNNTYTNGSSITTTVSYNNSDSYITFDLNNVDEYIDTDNAYIIPNSNRLKTDTKFHLGDIRKKKDDSPATKRCRYCYKRIIGRSYKCNKCAKEDNWHQVSKTYPWNKKPEKDTEFNYVPWNQKLTLKREERLGSNLRNIPWLSKLETRIFGYYEDELGSTEEVDNSSYLTNMRWLGIDEQSGRPRYTVQEEGPESLEFII